MTGYHKMHAALLLRRDRILCKLTWEPRKLRNPYALIINGDAVQPPKLGCTRSAWQGIEPRYMQISYLPVDRQV